MNIEDLTKYVFDYIKKTKGRCISIDQVSDILKEKLGDQYTSEIGIAVKSNLKEHEKLDFFREGDCWNGMKYFYCVGNWIALKGLYNNGIEAKDAIGVLSWQRFADDWEDD